ncbi:MAG: AAA family ATPase [Treponema sp.]|nr:AAA family ATPase [Treponema sp.]
MFLKSLDIFGFKSFADRTHIDFADGITALLGPNGCGKSNVVDAIKWVLAENKSKALRAEKMEDVIFNGTEKRSPLNVAEVTLTIMNENGLLPLESPEIAIRRRIFRSGENEYSINNRLVGPSEIRKLFMDTGVGKAAYSVMEQGKIDQILSKKPEDRRYLFEEAAGISRSKAQCVEAERELEKTRTNLQQIEVSLSEIKRSYDTLKVQSEKTIKYREAKDAIFNNELDIQLLKLKGFIEDKVHRENDLAETEQKRNAVRAEIEQINNTLSENMDKVKAMQEEVYAKQSELIGIQKEKTGKLDLAKQFNTRAQEIKEKISQLENHKKTIQDRIDALNEEIDDQDATLHQKTKQLADIQKNIQSFQDNITLAGSQIDDNDRKSAEYKKHITELDEQIVSFRTQLGAITEDIVKELDAKLKETGVSTAAVSEAKNTLETTLGQLKVFTEGRKNIFSDFVAMSKHSEEDIKKILKEVVDAFDESQKMLSKIENALQQYIKVSPQFLEEFLSPQGILTKKRAIDAQITQLSDTIASYQQKITDLHAENSGLLGKIEQYKETLHKLKLNQVEMQGQITASRQQIDILRRSLTSEQNTLKDTDDELYSETKRSEEINDQILTVQEELAEIEVRGQALAKKLTELDNQIAECNSNVSGKQNALRNKQEEQNKYQQKYEQLTLSLTTTDTEIRNIKQNFIDTHSRDLMEFEERMYTITTPAAVLREKLSQSREALKTLGQVNLMAPEEFSEVKERYERQQANYNDTLQSLENMQRVAEEIRSKSTEMFMETYNKIKHNFHNMFRRLFNGGRAELKLEDPQNVLTSGIDIYAQPPGKKLENIALLSGGEKTMTAVALLFATYQVRPSPFCLLDEIDAALDDKNVNSFVTALRAFANISQYIVITHNKKTVMGASTMLGVTMEESGISKVIALRLDQDIKINKPDIPDEEVPFVEEDVEPEQGVYIPPRPPKRIHNPDGTVTQTNQQEQNKEE